MQIEFNFSPVRVVKNTWSDLWHVMRGHYVWPEDTEQKCFESIEEAVAFAKKHGATPQVGKEAFHGR
jgi:sugar phosphate isomerase/epimerase